jgi:hypothetical protein
VIFPYEFHFKSINTHLLIEKPLSGEPERDRGLIYDAFRRGRAFIGYDLPAPTRGFHFLASAAIDAQMGETISPAGVTFQIRLPLNKRRRQLNVDYATWSSHQELERTATLLYTTTARAYRGKIY